MGDDTHKISHMSTMKLCPIHNLTSLEQSVWQFEIPSNLFSSLWFSGSDSRFQFSFSNQNKVLYSIVHWRQKPKPVILIQTK